MHTSRWQFLLILLVLGLLLLRESRRTPSEEVEHRFVDWLAAATNRDLPEAPCVLVGIDDSSLSEGHRWPWSPLDFTLFLQAALPFKPGVIAIEHVLNWEKAAENGDAERSTKNPQYERILRDYLLRAPKVVLGAELGPPEDPDVVPALQPMRVLRRIGGDASAVPEFTDVVREAKEELRLSSARGFVNLPGLGLGTGPVRRVPLLLRYRGEMVPSFVMQALLLFYQLTPDDVQGAIGSHLDLGGRRVPIDAQGCMNVYFKAPHARIGFDALLLAAQQVESGLPASVPLETLRDRIVLLARVDRASKTLNFPGGVHGSSGELFAAAIATIQTNTFVERLPLWGDAAIIAAVLVLAAFFPSWSKGTVVQVTLLSLALYLLAGLAIFTTTLRWVPLIAPAGVLLFSMCYRLLSWRSAPAEAGKVET